MASAPSSFILPSLSSYIPLGSIFIYCYLTIYTEANNIDIYNKRWLKKYRIALKKYFILFLVFTVNATWYAD